MSKSKLVLGALLLAVLVAALPLASACGPAAVKPEEFYKGSTMYIEVATDVGADADIIARTLSQTVKSYLGASSIVIENKTGGGGIEAWNGAWEASEDGLTIGEGEIADLVLLSIAGDARLKVKPEEAQFFWGEPNHPLLLVTKKDGPIKNVTDLKAAKDMKLGAATPGGNYCVILLFTIDALNLDAKVVTGISGSERELRVAQGTMTGSVFNEPRAARFIEQGTPILIFGPNRIPEYPSVPTLKEVIPNPTAQQTEYINLINDILIGGHNFFANPRVAKDKVAYLEKAFAEAGKVHMEEIKTKLVRPHITRFLTGAEVLAQSQLIKGKTADIGKRVTELFDKYKA